MKYVRQLLIILFVSFFGELLKYIIPLLILNLNTYFLCFFFSPSQAGLSNTFPSAENLEP